MMSQHGNNIVQAKWQPKSEISFLAGLKITALDTIGLLNRITSLISNDMKINLRSIQMDSSEDLVYAMISVYVHSTKELDALIDKLSKVREIQKVIRIANEE